jgi:hypothetical protein
MNESLCTCVLAIAALAATTALAGSSVWAARGAVPPVPRASDFSARASTTRGSR